jgi:hypothetical protein
MANFDKISRLSNTVFNVVDGIAAHCQDNGRYKNRFRLEVIGYNYRNLHLFSDGILGIIEHLAQHDDDEQFIDVNREAKPEGQTYMAGAFKEASNVINNWIQKQSKEGTHMPAPVVINITDGFPEERGLTPEEARVKALDAAAKLKNISVEDGNVLLFNIHIDGKGGTEKELLFPTVRPTDDRRSFLFDASSEMPQTFIERAKVFDLNALPGSKLMVSNVSDSQKLSRLVLFGSSATGFMR